jgi:hypothetical protein
MKKSYKLKFLLGSLAALIAPNAAEAQYVTFQQVYQSSVDRSARDILETPDGGYIIAGMSETSIPGDTNIYIIKTDNVGDIMWTKEYGGNNPDYPYNIVATPDGGYLLLGYTASYGAGDYDTWLVKVNSAGDFQWDKTYGGTGDDQGKALIATTDGNYMITGRTNTPNGNSATNYDAFLLKVDPSGTEIWTKYYGGGIYESGRALTQTADDGYALAGITNSFGSGMGDVYVVRTNSTGDTLWTKWYGGPNIDDGNEILTTPDGGFVISAETKSFGAGDFDVQLFKTDGNGSVVWNELYGGTEKDISHMLQKTSDGGYILGCISRSFGWIEPEMWLIKTNNSGGVAWETSYGSFDHEHLYAAKQTADGGYMVVGHSKSYGPNMKAMFLKLNDSGTFAVSVNEHVAAGELFTIYPNPSEGEVKIHWGQLGDSQLSVMNALGQTILTENINGNNSNGSTVIDLRYETPGIYLFNLRTADQSSTKRIIIR